MDVEQEMTPVRNTDNLEPVEDEMPVNSNGDRVEGSNDSENDNDETGEWVDVLGTGQLMKKVVVRGRAFTRPERLDLCLINLCGSLEDGTVVEIEQNLELYLGDCEVIQGIDLALALMEVGEQANLIVSPRFGYGSLGLEPNIPPDSTMHYDVELLEVKYGPSVSELSLNQRINTGNRKKDRGNWWYMRGEYSFAIQCYRRALEYFDDTDLPSLNTEEEVHILLEERLKTYNNLAAAQLKIKAHNAALISLEHVLTCQPSNVKALYRKAKILKEQGELESSVKCIREALSVEPNSQSLLQELSTLLATQKEENSKRRDLYKKMFRNTRDSEKTEGETQDNGNTNLWRWLTGIGLAFAIVGTLAAKFKY